MKTENICLVAKQVTLTKSKCKSELRHLEVQNLEITSETNLEEDLGLDSLDIVELTVDIEQAIPGYGVDEDELCDIKTFGDLVSRIKPFTSNN